MSSQNQNDGWGIPSNDAMNGTYRYGQWRDTGDSTPVVHPAYSDKDNSGTDWEMETTDNTLFKVHSFYPEAAR
jgi:hypothetical protein